MSRGIGGIGGLVVLWGYRYSFALLSHIKLSMILVGEHLGALAFKHVCVCVGGGGGGHVPPLASFP